MSPVAQDYGEAVKGLEPFGTRRREFGGAEGRKAERAGASKSNESDKLHPNRESDPFSEKAIRDSRLRLLR
jgi:hypothetical protein